MGRATQRGDSETKRRGPLHVDEDYSMGPYDFAVVAESGSAAVEVTLPPKAEAVLGTVYTIHAPAGASNDVSVLDCETATEISTYGDLDADGDLIGVVCTGELWAVVASVLG